MRSECRANPPLFELRAGRLTGKVCSRGAKLAEECEGTREGRRRPVDRCSPRVVRTGGGRGSARRQGLKRSRLLCAGPESRAGAQRRSQRHLKGWENHVAAREGLGAETGHHDIAGTVQPVAKRGQFPLFALSAGSLSGAGGSIPRGRNSCRTGNRRHASLITVLHGGLGAIPFARGAMPVASRRSGRKQVIESGVTRIRKCAAPALSGTSPAW